MNTNYWINFTVSDDDNISDLDNVVVKVYYTCQEPGTTDKRMAYKFTWTESTLGDFVSAPGGYMASNTVPIDADRNNKAFAFSLEFKIDHVSIPSAEIGQWYINITAVNDTGESATDTSVNFDVNKYKSLTTSISTIDYGPLGPGADIPDLTPMDLTITANTQLNVTVQGADLTSDSYSIGIANFDVNATTPPTVGGRFGPLTLSTGAQTIYNDTAETACTLETDIIGYSSAYSQLELVFGGGNIPTPQQDGAYAATWQIACNSDMLTSNKY